MALCLQNKFNKEQRNNMKKINEKLETSIDQKIFEERYGPLPPGMFPEIKEEEDES